MNRKSMMAITIVLTLFLTTSCASKKVVSNNSGSAIITAAPYQTSAATNNWGTAVVRHLAKENVYEEFYSADFGSAGRWMTTNLSTKAYDTDLGQDLYHSGGRVMTGPIANPGDPYKLPCNTAYWAYPKTDGPVVDFEEVSAQYTANPHLGLLYTWDAATAGKGGVSGLINVDNPAPGNPANGENGLSEWDGKGVQPANTQKRRQGVCPSGWHLPSDNEWTDLEREIIKNTSKYATQANIDKGDGTEINKVNQNDKTGYRGSNDGNAMKNVKQSANDPAYKGTSKPIDQNGFDVLFAGFASTGLSNQFGSYGYFWSSSSAGENVAWFRSLDNNNAGVFRNANYRVRMFSVRCVKDK
jgi:uncharacterized protein (TIGR02145 family)